MSARRPLWLASLLSWLLVLVYAATLRDGLDPVNYVVGHDFVNQWTAGRLVVEGRLAEVFDDRAFHAAIRAWVDPRIPYHFWSYPPPALLLAAPFGLLPYGWALAVWSLLGIAALYLALRAAFPKADWLLLLFCPAVACNLVMGQNGAVTAALLIGALALMDRRPAVAGLMMGLLVFKPHLALVLPVAVVAARQWRTFAAAALTTAAVLVLATLVFGLDAWRDFFGPTLRAQDGMMVHGIGPFLWMMPSAFAAGRVFGLTDAAFLLQLPFALFAAVLTWKAYRSDAPPEAKLAVGLAAGLCATPQAFNYDLIPALAAAAVVWRTPRKGLAWLVLALVWLLPFLVIPLNLAKAPLGPLLLAGLLWLAYGAVRPAAAQLSPR